MNTSDAKPFIGSAESNQSKGLYFWSIYGLFASLCVIQYAEKVHISTNVSLLDGLVGFIIIFFMLSLLAARFIPAFAFHIVYLGLLIFMLWPLMQCESLLSELSQYGKYVLYFLMTLCVTVFINQKKQFLSFIRCIFISFTIPVLISVYEMVTHSGMVDRGFHMFTGGYHHPGIIAYSFLFLVPLTLFFIGYEGKKSTRIIWVLVFLFLIIMIVLTYRRNVWGGLLILLLAWSFLRKKWSSILAVFIFFISLLVFSPTLRSRLDDHTYLVQKVLSGEKILIPQNDHIFSARMGLLRVNFEEFEKSPLSDQLFGAGFGRTIEYSHKHGIPIGGHNIYLVFLVDTGFVGLVLFLLSQILLLFQAFNLFLSQNRLAHNFGLTGIIYILLFLFVGMGTHITYNLIPGVFIYGAVCGLMFSLIGIDRRLNIVKRYLCVKKKRIN